MWENESYFNGGENVNYQVTNLEYELGHLTWSFFVRCQKIAKFLIDLTVFYFIFFWMLTNYVSLDF